MRFPFLELPGSAHTVPRPVVPVQLEDLEETRLVCLLDTGALGNRLGAWAAQVAGIELDDPDDEDEIFVAGVLTRGRCVRVDLTIGDHRLDVPVWFCEPWPFDFGLLGQDGFLRYFKVTIRAAESWLECEPESAR